MKDTHFYLEDGGIINCPVRTWRKNGDRRIPRLKADGFNHLDTYLAELVSTARDYLRFQQMVLNKMNIGSFNSLINFRKSYFRPFNLVIWKRSRFRTWLWSRLTEERLRQNVLFEQGFNMLKKSLVHFLLSLDKIFKFFFFGI